MHELSIAHAIVDAVAEAAGDTPVAEVRVRIGALSGVVADALVFSFDLVTDGTVCAGARLLVDEVPVAVWCAPCTTTATLAAPLRFRCPTCGTPTDDVRAGRELEIVSYTPALVPTAARVHEDGA